ncbi:MAG TPA: hypothetical protein DCX77_07225 [Acidimicrobiaceae bacterium]|nr:hypothetical protein [Acidimicrobiaceae bacterium]HAX05455.1 hypothetical protein [Acidimicrobiaceae bacterium]|tara:strand:+ start:58 stop:1077 length:1020 start_codon:yes stop_codon:yes gene_type:complete
MTRFDLYAEEALYGPRGFYTQHGTAGTEGGDFITSPETSTLFGACVASYLDQVWHELECPDPFVVVEAGSGPGSLCRDIFLSIQDSHDALRYVMVERSDRQREIAFAQVTATCFADLEEAPVAALKDLPVGPITGVVLANELLDNLPPRVVRKTTEGWLELHVQEGNEAWHPAEQSAATMASAVAPNAPLGATLPLHVKAAVWMNRAMKLLERGRILTFDYGVDSSEALFDRPLGEWLRTYRGHHRAGVPYSEPGTRDITCDVAFDQLPGSPLIRLQADWLASKGIEEMTQWAREQWQDAAASPDSTSVAARQVLDEAAALTSRTGLGAFLVAEWQIGD